MKRHRLLYFIFILILTVPARAQDRGYGIGMILGEPTGISMKTWASPDVAYDFAAAWSFKGNDSFTLHADYLRHDFRLLPVEKGRMAFYYGLGGRIKFKERGTDEDTVLGARVPLGINYHFENITLDLFFEIVPILELVPETEFNLNGAIGVRFFLD